MKHPQAELIKQWLKDTDQCIWVLLADSKTWSESYLEELLACPNLSYAVGDKPTSPPTKMCELAGVKFPAPNNKALTKHALYFIADAAGHSYSASWYDESSDCKILDAGLIHLTRKAADQHSQALMAANLQATEYRVKPSIIIKHRYAISRGDYCSMTNDHLTYEEASDKFPSFTIEKIVVSAKEFEL